MDLVSSNCRFIFLNMLHIFRHTSIIQYFLIKRRKKKDDKYSNVSSSTGLPTKDETVKTTWNFLILTIQSLNQAFCLDCDLEMSYLMILQKKKFLFAENREYKQGYNARKVNCGGVYSAYILKPVLSGRNCKQE